MQPADKSTLVGFFGAETMGERIARAPPPLKVRIGRKRREGKTGEGVEGGEGRGDGEAGGRRRRGSLGNWLSRKRTG